MPGYKIVPKKTYAELGRQWDALADLRNFQISSGADVTFNRIMLPFFVDEVSKKWNRRALDVGCGTGHLTNNIAKFCGDVTGIDISRRSIDIAENQFSSNRVRFLQYSMQSFSQESRSKFNLLIANMVLMDVMDLGSFLRSARMVITKGGKLIATLTHPAFWPRYYGFEADSWFRYSDELCIEGPFKISDDYTADRLITSTASSTQVHRPLESYFSQVRASGFRIDRMIEMRPTREVEALYPRPWDFPRYLALIATSE